MYDLLVQNYVEDDDAMFRFDYSKEFLRWALLPPGYNPDWLIGVRAGPKRKLFGCITGIPVTMYLNGREVNCAEINFLCVHKKLRAKRLAPILIKEITRRVNRCDIWQAIYTAGATIPTPITGAQYWHRSLNPQKLIDVGFSYLPSGKTMTKYVKENRLRSLQIPEMRPMVESDLAMVTELLNNHLRNFKVHIHFTLDEVAHFLLPRDKVVYSYCVDGPRDSDGKIPVIDFFSFYCLPSQILRHPEHKILNVAYSFYNFVTPRSTQE